jgi:hypothetical protein
MTELLRYLPASLLAVQQLRPLLSLRARSTGRRYCGARGSGKSALLAWLTLIDLAAGLPGVALDPAGAIAYWLFGILEHESEETLRRVLPKLRYYAMKGVKVGPEIYLPTWALLYRREPDEPLEAIARRPLEVWLRADPALSRAPIQGANALMEIGSYALMLLFAMEPPCQVTELAALLENPLPFRDRILAARERYPDELARPAHFFLEAYPTLSERDRVGKVAALQAKLPMFTLNRILKAQYGADFPSTTVAEIERDGVFAIVDFQGMAGDDEKSFSVKWLNSYFMHEFRARRPGKDQVPLCYTIDEASFILPGKGSRNDLLKDDFTQFTQQVARQNNIFMSIVHQEIRQFDDQINELLMQFGTQILGATADLEGAVQVSQRFHYYDPYKVKRMKNVWATDPTTREHFVIDQDPIYFTEREQALANARQLLALKPFNFQIGTAPEGALPTSLRHIDLAAYAEERFPRSSSVEAVRIALAQRDGRTLSSVLHEIDRRRVPVRVNLLPPPDVSGSSQPPSHPFQPSVRIPKPRAVRRSTPPA